MAGIDPPHRSPLFGQTRRHLWRVSGGLAGIDPVSVRYTRKTGAENERESPPPAPGDPVRQDQKRGPLDPVSPGRNLRATGRPDPGIDWQAPEAEPAGGPGSTETTDAGAGCWRDSRAGGMRACSLAARKRRPYPRPKRRTQAPGTQWETDRDPDSETEKAPKRPQEPLQERTGPVTPLHGRSPRSEPLRRPGMHSGGPRLVSSPPGRPGACRHGEQDHGIQLDLLRARLSGDRPRTLTRTPPKTARNRPGEIAADYGEEAAEASSTHRYALVRGPEG